MKKPITSMEKRKLNMDSDDILKAFKKKKVRIQLASKEKGKGITIEGILVGFDVKDKVLTIQNPKISKGSLLIKGNRIESIAEVKEKLAYVS